MFNDRLIFEPVCKPNETFYKCDSKFILDEIVSMYDVHDTNGIIHTDGNYCTWYTLNNNNFTKIASKSIYLQNQFAGGGQSQNRLMRNRDIQREQNITSLAERTIEIFYYKDNSCQTVVNIIFCGPAEFKTELSEHKLIRQFFNNIHILNMSDINYDMVIDYVKTIIDPNEFEIIKRLRYMISMADAKLVFGLDINTSLELCEIKTLYVHKDHDFLKKYDPAYKLEIIKISSTMINEYGGMIGVKFY
jgi:peptide subunit release factor 1 (eRF1)